MNYIVMEYIDGLSLTSFWALLDMAAKSAISDQVWSHFIQLCTICSLGYYGLLGKRLFDDSVFWNGDDVDLLVSGLFGLE